MQLLVPRTNACKESSKIILTKKDVYSIKTSDAFKEVRWKNQKAFRIMEKVKKVVSIFLVRIMKLLLCEKKNSGIIISHYFYI